MFEISGDFFLYSSPNVSPCLADKTAIEALQADNMDLKTMITRLQQDMLAMKEVASTVEFLKQQGEQKAAEAAAAAQ